MEVTAAAVFSGGGWVNTSTGRSAVTSQMVPPSSPSAMAGAGTDMEKVLCTV